MIPVSTTKHKIAFWNVDILLILGSIFWEAWGGASKIRVQNDLLLRSFPNKEKIYDGEILIRLRNPKTQKHKKPGNFFIFK